jgi:hypothetical protein
LEIRRQGENQSACGSQETGCKETGGKNHQNGREKTRRQKEKIVSCNRVIDYLNRRLKNRRFF